MMGYPEEQEFDPSWVCCLLDGIPANCCDDFGLDSTIPWPSPDSQPFISPTSLSKSPKDSCGTLDGAEECCRKRVRGGSSCVASARACREKMRRDRVNERFLELGSVLEPGRTPKLDKAVILTDAVQTVKLLLEETRTLKSQNVELKRTINELKAEKKELRAEKHRMKTEKENLEQRIKTLGAPHGMQVRTAARPPAYAIPSRPVGGKLMPFFNYPGVPLWHYVPHAAVDTSQDHALHPPVA